MTVPFGAVEFYLLILVFALLFTAYWGWMLVDAIRVPDGQYRSGDKVVWVIVIVLTGVLGALIYQLVGRPRTAAPQDRASTST